MGRDRQSKTFSFRLISLSGTQAVFVPFQEVEMIFVPREGTDTIPGLGKDIPKGLIKVQSRMLVARPDGYPFFFTSSY